VRLAVVVVILAGCAAPDDATIGNRSTIPAARVRGRNSCAGPKSYPVIKPPFGRGAIVGIVRDVKKCEPLAGATIVAEAPTLGGERAVISDEAGVFILSELPAGRYRLTYYYSDRQELQPGVAVRADETTRVLHAMIVTPDASVTD
jgi:carboxypeptidase family protein